MILFEINKITFDKLRDYLKEVDHLFPIPLSQEVDIDQYALKLANNATIFTASDNGELIALVAVYVNDSFSKKAFITSVSTIRSGQGITSNLMQMVIKHVKEQGFTFIYLEVDITNIKAIRLYGKFGFKHHTESKNNKIYMKLEL